jgi:hypothetical protein
VKKRINQDSSRFTVLFLPKIFYFLFGLSINYILIYYSYLKVNYLICGKNIYIRFSNFKIVLTLKNNYNCSIKSHKNNNKIIMSFFSQIKFYYSTCLTTSNKSNCLLYFNIAYFSVQSFAILSYFVLSVLNNSAISGTNASSIFGSHKNDCNDIKTKIR